MVPEFVGFVWPGRSVRRTELSQKGLAVGAIRYGQSGKTPESIRNRAAESIIDSFARFLVPEIQKFYASEQGQKELAEWEKKFSDKSEE